MLLGGLLLIATFAALNIPTAPGYATVICALIAGGALGVLAHPVAVPMSRRVVLALIVCVFAAAAIWQAAGLIENPNPASLPELPASAPSQRI